MHPSSPLPERHGTGAPAHGGRRHFNNRNRGPRRYPDARPSSGGQPPVQGGMSFARSAKRLLRDRKRPLPSNNALFSSNQKKSGPIPDLAPDTIRIIPLGGVEEIGRNMTAVEYNNDIFVIDAGFMFREDDTPGVDYILPNTEYLEKRKEKIRALIVTHGHLDHIGGVPYIMDRIGNPPVYTRRLTSLMLKKRHEEFQHLPALDIREVENDSSVTIGALSVGFFGVTHTIPDAMGVNIKTPFGNVTITGDIKLNHIDGDVTPAEEKGFEVFKKEKSLVLLMDSTNVERPGWSIPESKVFETFEGIIAAAEHRMIIASFASQLERVIKIIDIAERRGKKIVIEGRSMKTNLAIAQEIGLLKTQKGTIISAEEMRDFPESKIIILATGAQGDSFAALMRIANKTHKYVTLTPRDTVVLSSSVIPGNERAVQKLKDNISRQGAHIITYQTSDLNVHASGHGNQEEAKWIHSRIRPTFFIPQHGYHYMLRVHADVIQESAGVKPENIVIPDNGSIIEIRDAGTKIVHLDVKAPMQTRIVEGFHVRELQEAVIRDRQMLANDGIFVVVATVNIRTGRLKKSPDIISRGFVYLRESQDLLNQARLIVKKTVEQSFARSRGGNSDRVKDDVAHAVSEFLLQATHKNPMVIPVIVGV